MNFGGIDSYLVQCTGRHDVVLGLNSEDIFPQPLAPATCHLPFTASTQPNGDR